MDDFIHAYSVVPCYSDREVNRRTRHDTSETLESQWGETSLITNQIKPQGEMQRNIIHLPPRWNIIAKCIPAWQT